MAVSSCKVTIKAAPGQIKAPFSAMNRAGIAKCQREIGQLGFRELFLSMARRLGRHNKEGMERGLMPPVEELSLEEAGGVKRNSGLSMPELK